MHFPPRHAGLPAPQPSLAVLAVSFPGESAVISHDFGALPPTACRATGSTDPSRRTFRFFPRGKCRDFPRERCTFTPGLPGYLLHRPLSSHQPFLSPGKVPGIPTILVHFHPWLAGTPTPQTSLTALVVSSRRMPMKTQQSKRPGPPIASRRVPPSRAEGG